MAIKIPMTWRGISIPNAYIRVDRIQGGKRENRSTPQEPGEAIWHATVGIYADENQLAPALTLTVTAPMTGEDRPFAVLYAALKALPEFSGAVDV